MRISPTIRKYANEDINRVLEEVSQALRLPLQLDRLSFESRISHEDLKANGGDYESFESITVTAEISVDDRNTISYSWEYSVADDDVFFSGIKDMIAGLKGQLAEDGLITASTRRHGRSRIVAADEFGTDDMAAFDDQLDTISDTVDDIKDAVDEIAEDDPKISIDNNIADHYIAECDKCKGVFISAVVESDQEVESVSGICPLCGKESDQRLKWIIRPANEGVFEDLELDEEALQ